MKSSVEPLEGNLVKLNVTVDAADVEKAIAETYTETAKKVRVPGFRAGKAPRPMIDRYVGRERVLADAQQLVVERSYPQAIDAEDLRPIDQPDLGELTLLAEGEDYSYTAEVQVRPELPLTGDWKHMKVEIPSKNVTDAQIDAQIDEVRERFASLEVVEDRGVADGDFVLLSFTGLVDGEAYEGNTVDKLLYELGRGQMPKEFDDAMIGAKPGDTATATFVIPDTSANADFVGKTATFEITVHEIKTKQLPPLDAEFAENAGGFDSMEQMRADVQTRMVRQREMDYDRELERALRSALADHLEGEVPEIMVMERRDTMIRDFFGNLERQGVSLKDYVSATGVDPEQIQKDIEGEARSRVRQELALESLARAEGMTVTDEDIETDLVELASSSGKTPAELRQQWEDAGLRQVLEEQVLQSKAARWLHEHVQVAEASPEAGKAAAEEPAKPKKPRKSAKKKEEEE